MSTIALIQVSAPVSKKSIQNSSTQKIAEGTQKTQKKLHTLKSFLRPSASSAFAISALKHLRIVTYTFDQHHPHHRAPSRGP
jgi:hypothetical protein